MAGADNRAISARFCPARALLPPLIALAVVFFSAPAFAYTWMIRHGYSGCVTCHTDPSGGELLTPYGRVQGDLILRMRYGKDSVSAAASDTSGGDDSFGSFDSFDESAPEKPEAAAEEPAAPAEGEDAGPADSAGFLWGLWEPPEFLLLGGSLRGASTYKFRDKDKFAVFPMQADLYGQLQFGAFRASGTIGVSRVDAGSPHARAAQITTDQGDGFNLISRTHWLGADFSEGEFTLRAGRLNLPFGIRIPEHVMWVREATRTDRESDQQHGVALAFNGSFLRGEIMGIAGNYQINPDKFRERGYSLYLEAAAATWAGVGVSSLLTVSQVDRVTLVEEPTTRQSHGVYTRMAPIREIAILLEADALLRSRATLGYVGFLQGDFEFVQGLHFLLTGEVLDLGRPSENFDESFEQPGSGKPRFGGWVSVDWFFMPHLEFRLDAIGRQQEPFTLLAQIHAYL